MCSFAVSWSGGKEGCLSLWKALSERLEVAYLFNTYRREHGRVAFHGTKAELIGAQAEALGIPLIQVEVSDDDYETRFLDGLAELKSKGVDGLIFGDIDILQNRNWSEQVSSRAGLDSLFPLWNLDQKDLLNEFVGSGFRALVVSLDSRYFARNNLGKQIDMDWVRSIERRTEEDVISAPTYCGERGEYHTFVYDGPCFRKALNLSTGETVKRRDHWLMDLRLTR